MSSTNRGKQRERDDYYATPEWVVRALLPFLKVRDGDDVLDPCCGSGAILDIFAPPQLTIPATKIAAPTVSTTFGIEIDGARADAARGNGHEVSCEDALVASWPSCALTITNPPFSKAQAFVERAIEAATPGCTVAMLLRLAFLESATRAPFHAKHPSDVYVFASRPSFTENGKTDSCAYAWFVWSAKTKGRLRVLPDVDPSRKRRVAA